MDAGWQLEALEARRLLASTIDFIAFNDSSAGPQTGINTTLYRADGTTAGLLKNSATGANTAITLTTLATSVTYQTNGAAPAAGTDAAAIFNGFVDFSTQVNNSIELAAGSSYTYRFTGLSTTARYGFTGTGIRGEPTYTNRWTLVTLVGAVGFTPAHSSGNGIVVVAPNQVAVWTGANHQAGQGFVAQWTDIDAGADGQFEIVSTQYTGATPGVGTGTANGAKGYVIEGLRLIQYTAITAPTVANAAATSVESFTATARGTVTQTGNESPSVTVFYGTTNGGTNPAAWAGAIALGAQSGDFSAALAGLTQNTNYFYRARAVNSAGETWAATSSTFTTRVLAQPAVITGAASDVQAFSATLPGQVTDTGGDAPAVTLYYGPSDGGTTPGNWANSLALGKNSGAFSSFIEGLSQNTTYQYRARAVNAAGEVWTTARSFTTLPVTLATIVNTAATSVQPFQATIGGNVTNLGGDPPIVTLFYGTADGGTNPAAWGQSVIVGETFGAYNATIQGLADGTGYFFRSRAVNAAGTVWAAPSLTFTTPAAPTLKISEFMASNGVSLTTRIRSTPTGAFGATLAPDWIEVQNLTGQAIDLGGYSLTDKSNDLQQWIIPAGTMIAANGYRIFFASNEDIRNPALDEHGFLHTNFALSAGGEYLALVKPSGQVVHAYSPQFPGQSTDISYGLSTGGSEVYFSTSTPGTSNAAGVINFVADTRFSVDRGFYSAPIDVAITTGTPGATIRYTLDGSAPTTANGIIYTGPIHITKTTALRAIAYKSGFVSTDTDTQTYIFLNDVIQQTAATTLAAGFPSSWNGTAPDYGLDPDVIGPGDKFGGLYVNQIKNSLLSVPTISIVGNINDIFGASGIYSNPTNDTLEITVSAELIMPDGSEGFQINSGLKIQGGAFRSFGLSKKKSLRLKFSEPHGPTKLNFPFFGDDAADSFDTITLRMEANDGWQWSAAGSQPQYARDEFARQSMLDMGQPASHGERMHLYINGVYWGVYNPVERPEASFAAAYFGGDKSEWDVQNSGTPVDGDLTSWNALLALSAAVQSAATSDARRAAYQTVLGNNADGSDNPALESYLDVANYADYLIVNWYGGNSDWPSHNYYMGRRRGPESEGFVFFIWDAEWTLFMQSNINTNRLTTIQGPVVPYDRLKASEDFRLAFADRVQKAFMEPGGAFYVDPSNPLWDPLHPERNVPAARYVAITDELPMALIAESARWGDQWRTTDPYTVEKEWRTERNHILNDWFPQRSAVMMSQFRAAGLYPSFDAPTFRVNGAAKHGGVIGTGDTITFSAPAGTVYYTLDGTDPRKPDGTLSASALTYTGGFQIGQARHIAARLRTAAGAWSALSETQFYVNALAAAGDLVVTEVMYNPPTPTLAELAAQAAIDPAFNPGNPSTNHYEFIELMNVSSHAVNLDGTRFKQVGIGNDGINLTFGNVVIAAGQRFVVAANLAAFQARYGTGITPVGVFSADLSNGGEVLSIFDAKNRPMLSFAYDDSGSWPGRADGGGSSAELVNLAGDLSNGNNWRASSEYLGTPGAAGLGPDNRVVINEILSHTDPPLKDSIELYNTTALPINIGGWLISDSSGNLGKFRVPDGTIIGALAYLVFDEDDFNPGGGAGAGDFAFDAAHGDQAYLVQPDAAGRPMRFVDAVSFGAQANGESWGRVAGTGRLAPMLQRTLGAPNSGPRVGPVVINEIHYNPVDPGNLPVGVDVGDLEFIEVYNPTALPVLLTNWRIRGGIDFDFAAGTTLAGGAALVIVSFNPASAVNAAKTQAFRAAYGISAAVPLVGGYSGRLDNSGESVQLERPDEPPSDEPLFFPRLLEDEADYEAAAPWPVLTDNTERSLHRLESHGFGGDGASWLASAPSPGTGGAPPAVTQLLLRGSAWTPAFINGLRDAGLGDGGYALGLAAAEAPQVAWTGLNQVMVRFSENIIAAVGNMELRGVNTALAATGTFTYDSATFTATWTFPEALGADKWLIVLGSAITDGSGLALNNPPVLRFNVLPGDVNRSGAVEIDDVIAVRNAQSTAAGSPGYSALFDADGSGAIELADMNLVRARQFTRLPAGEPVSPAPLALAISAPRQPVSLSAAPLSGPTRAAEPRRNFGSMAALFSMMKPPVKQIHVDRLPPAPALEVMARLPWKRNAKGRIAAPLETTT
jgi:hypothetical protein